MVVLCKCLEVGAPEGDRTRNLASCQVGPSLQVPCRQFHFWDTLGKHDMLASRVEGTRFRGRLKVKLGVLPILDLAGALPTVLLWGHRWKILCMTFWRSRRR